MKKPHYPFLTTTHWIVVACSITSAAIASVATLLISVFAPTALIQQVVHPTYTFPVVLFSTLVLLATISQYAYMIIGHELTFALIRSFRLFVYQRIVRVPLVVWHNWRHGDIVERLMRNLESLDGLLLRVFLPCCASTLVFVFYMAWLWAHTHPLVALAHIACVASLLGYYIFTHKARLGCAQERASIYVDMREDALNLSAARRELQLFFAEKQAHAQLTRSTQRHTQVHAKTAHYTEYDALLGRIATLIAFAVMIGWWTIAQPTTSWQTTACLLAVVPVMSLVGRMLASGQAWFVVQVAYSRIETCTQQATVETALATSAHTIAQPPSLSCHNLSFRYQHNDTVATHRTIDSLSLVCAAGTTSLVCGKSGVGKSTLLHLLAGYYTPEAGQVLIDGVDITHLSAPERQALVTFIPQSYPLLYCSLADSMRLARQDTTTEQMHAALNTVGLMDWYATLPSGMETIIGQGAHGLSGGELRRFALACALLRDTPIWLLDEPLAHLDEHSRTHIAALINQQTTHKTTLIVTHSHAALFEYQQRFQYDGARLTLCDAA